MTAAEFWGEIAKEAGLPDDKVKAIVDLTSDERVLKAVENRTMLRSDYSRKQDELKALETKNVDYYNKELAASIERQKVVDAANAQVAKYEQLYGALDGTDRNNHRNVVDTSVIDNLKKEMVDKFATYERNTISIMKDATRIASEHTVRFNEALDVDALEKFAVEKGLPLRAAYDSWIAPRLSEKEKAVRETEKKSAYEQGVKDTMSKHQLPTPESATRESHPFFDSYRSNKAKEKEAGSPKTGRELRDNFVQSWNEAGAATASSSK